MSNYSFDLKGAFLKAWKIKNNKLTDQYFYIKLTEIKLIEPYEENSIISTFKEVRYLAEIDTETLIKIINCFIFEEEKYFDLFGNVTGVLES